MSDQHDNPRQSALNRAELALAEHDRDTVLDEVLNAARELTGARYAALCVLNPDRTGLERFITAGIDEHAHARTGMLPRGRGLLGDLILDPSPLRLSELRNHPQAYGFPPGHPPMRSFLGVPILVDHTAHGSVYVAEKADGQAFCDDDERSMLTLATFAGRAIGHDRRHSPAVDTGRRADRN